MVTKGSINGILFNCHKVNNTIPKIVIIIFLAKLFLQTICELSKILSYYFLSLILNF